MQPPLPVQPGSPLMEIVAVVLYPPNGPPIKVDGGSVMGTQIQGGLASVHLKGAGEGQVRTFVGMAFEIVTQSSPSGLVAPHS
jgi:hypothetical protein